MTADLPEMHSNYLYCGLPIMLMYPDELDGIWEVYDGDSYLGRIIRSTEPTIGTVYAARVPGDESIAVGGGIESWELLVEYLCDRPWRTLPADSDMSDPAWPDEPILTDEESDRLAAELRMTDEEFNARRRDNKHLWVSDDDELPE